MNTGRIGKGTFEGNKDILIKQYGELIKDKQIYNDVVNGNAKYYFVMLGDEIIDDFFLFPNENNLINLNTSLKDLERNISSVMYSLSFKYDHITFILDENTYGKEKTNYIRDYYEVISDSVNDNGMTEIVVKTKRNGK